MNGPVMMTGQRWAERGFARKGMATDPAKEFLA